MGSERPVHEGRRYREKGRGSEGSAEAQEENSLLQSRLDSKANISYIEEYAANELGMAKVTNSQINYLDVNTENLIEVTPENNGSIFSAVADWFGDLLEYIGF